MNRKGLVRGAGRETDCDLGGRRSSLASRPWGVQEVKLMGCEVIPSESVDGQEVDIEGEGQALGKVFRCRQAVNLFDEIGCSLVVDPPHGSY